jgi:hypothetical protein
MFVHRLGAYQRSVDYLPLIEAVPSLESLAMRHLSKSLEPLKSRSGLGRQAQMGSFRVVEQPSLSEA